ncbi:hypothetical protein JYJ95_16190 [Corallococcus exiguus]|uniref:hypothetical protein n=1 Tax=Corallococcus exiguus TaxID=83462 RepID=UPI001A8F12CB|nr:hypothetical protein [Corallococcus exiguus]MBN8468061.1 hypothetical protein [Corallococcus exiguus]
MALESGDHVWYWNGRTSQNKDIPRAEWFPDSNPNDPNDYQGNGADIYNYVFYDDQIAVGQPQMRRGLGSFAWLNNNPGNITGVAGGPDFGQYPNKFNWHNFLIFPTWQAGFDALAAYLRQGSYPSLSILQGLRKYAPAGDGGNLPDQYAAQVAAALGVPVDTLIGDLSDQQMLAMQNKIMEIEGVIPGQVLPYDSADIPAEISQLLA